MGSPIPSITQGLEISSDLIILIHPVWSESSLRSMGS